MRITRREALVLDLSRAIRELFISEALSPDFPNRNVYIMWDGILVDASQETGNYRCKQMVQRNYWETYREIYKPAIIPAVRVNLLERHCRIFRSTLSAVRRLPI